MTAWRLPSRVSPDQVPEKTCDGVVCLNSIVQAHSRFTGLRELLLILGFVVCSAVVPASLMHENEGLSRSLLNDHVVNWGDVNEVHDSISAGVYFAGYTRDLLELSEALEPSLVSLDDYNKVIYISLLVTLDHEHMNKDTTLQSAFISLYQQEELRCYGVSHGRAQTFSFTKNTSFTESDYYRCELLIFSNKNMHTMNRTLALQKVHFWDSTVLTAPLSVAVNGRAELSLVTILRKEKDGVESAIGSLSRFWYDNSRHEPQIWTMPIRAVSLYGNRQACIRAFFEVLWILSGFALYVEERKTKFANKKAKRRHGTFSSWADNTGTTLFLLTLCWHYILLTICHDRFFRNSIWPTTLNHVNRLSKVDGYVSAGTTFRMSIFLQADLNVMTLHFFFSLVRVARRLRHHPGTYLYIEVFAQCFERARDFAVWLSGILVGLAVTYWLFFATVGGNLDFRTFATSLHHIALTTLGYYEFETFANNYSGFGAFRDIPIACFYILIIITFLVAQNILLAIVTNGYDRAVERIKIFESDTRLDPSLPLVCTRRLLYLCGFSHFLGIDIVHKEVSAKWNLLRKSVTLRLLCEYLNDADEDDTSCSAWLWDDGEAIKNLIGCSNGPFESKVPQHDIAISGPITKEQLLDLVKVVQLRTKEKEAHPSDIVDTLLEATSIDDLSISDFTSRPLHKPQLVALLNIMQDTSIQSLEGLRSCFGPLDPTENIDELASEIIACFSISSAHNRAAEKKGDNGVTEYESRAAYVLYTITLFFFAGLSYLY